MNHVLINSPHPLRPLLHLFCVERVDFTFSLQTMLSEIPKNFKREHLVIKLYLLKGSLQCNITLVKMEVGLVQIIPPNLAFP